MGNTCLKWANVTDGEIVAVNSIANDQLSTASISKLWSGLSKQEEVWVANVASPQLLKLVSDWVWQNWQCHLQEISVHNDVFNVQLAYSNVEQYGVDRWLGLLVAQVEGLTPCCVVSCGTALTIDVIDAYGKHKGGVISSGVGTMLASLESNTYRLPKVENAQISPWSCDTISAIFSGTLLSAVGLVTLVTRFSCENMAKQKLNMIITGGDSQKLIPHLDVDWINDMIVRPNLVLEGIQLVASRDSS